MRRRAASIRVRIVFGYLVLLTTALTIAVVVTRQVQINRVERDIETEQLQEVEEISLLAADGRDPDTPASRSATTSQRSSTPTSAATSRSTTRTTTRSSAIAHTRAAIRLPICSPCPS